MTASKYSNGSPEPPSREHGDTEGTLTVPDSESASAAKNSLTVAELLKLSAREKAGEPLNDEERQQLAEAEAGLRETIEGFRTAWVTLAERLKPVLEQLPRAFEHLAQWQRTVYEAVAPVVGQFAVAVRDMPPRIRSALLALAERGWYLDGSHGFSELWALDEALGKGEVELVDATLTEHFESRLAEIEEELVRALPAREKILRAAITAHRRREFELSVPVLLAQSDGACLDLTGYHLFMKDSKSKLPEASIHALDAARDAFSAAMLSPLSKVLPINANPRDRERFLQDRGLTTWSELNRHLVLHGESCDYGTQTNSLKTISLINYLVCFAARRISKVSVAADVTCKG